MPRLETVGGPNNPELKTIRLLLMGTVALVILVVFFASYYIVRPGYRGVRVTLGAVSDHFLPEGFGLKMPLITDVVQVLVKQQTAGFKTECFSSDLQHIVVDVRLLYRIPEASVVAIFKQYAGDPFDNLILPRVSEAIKEVTALQSAEQIVKKREAIKSSSLEITRKKVGDILMVEDLVIQDIKLSRELAFAIEQKMVQEQEAAKAKFIQQKAEIEAHTAVIRAKGEAESIQIRGQALRNSPNLIQLQIVEKWDGKAPLVVNGSAGGSNIILPLESLRKHSE